MASRRAAGARSPPRPAARTGSGGPPAGRPAGGAPAAAPPLSDQPPSDQPLPVPAPPSSRLSRPYRRPRHRRSLRLGPVRLPHRVPQPLVPRRARHQRGVAIAVPRAGADDHVAGLAGQAEVQPVLGELLNIGGGAEPLLLALQRPQLGEHHLPLCQQPVDLAGLGDVLPHRVGQAQRDRADHHGQHRSPAGEPGPVGWRWPPAVGHHGPGRVRGKAGRPAYSAASSSTSSIRSSWLYLATRSVRAGAPVLSWPQLVATARSAMVVSSVSPDRWLIMQANPLRWARVTASRVSVTVPIWFSLTSSAFAACSAIPRRSRSGLVTKMSSPTICTWSPSSAVSAVQPAQSSSASGSSSE